MAEKEDGERFLSLIPEGKSFFTCTKNHSFQPSLTEILISYHKPYNKRLSSNYSFLEDSHLIIHRISTSFEIFL